MTGLTSRFNLQPLPKMTTTNRESIRPRLVGYTYEGGLDLETGCRPASHRSLSRDDMRRAYRKKERARWRRDFPTNPEQY